MRIPQWRIRVRVILEVMHFQVRIQKILKSLTIKRGHFGQENERRKQVELNEVFRESKRTRSHSCYVAQISELIKTEPANVEEALSCQP